MRKLLPALVLITACGADGQRQQSTVCDSCAIELRHVASLDFSDAPFMPSMFVNVERLHDGTFVVTDWARANTEILHFSATGRYIDSHLRAGEGPGETKSPTSLLAQADSLWVMDVGLARCSLLDSAFQYVMGFQCTGHPGDATVVGGGYGPMGLVEYGVDGERHPARTEGDPVPFSDEYQSLASDGRGGVWFVNHPNRYRLTYWMPGEQAPSKSIERNPSWWKPVEKFLMTKGPTGGPVRNAEERQVMSGPLLFNVGVSGGFVWTASYIYTRKDRQYGDFLSDWLDQGIEGDVRVFIEALTPEGELVASMAHDNMAPPRFTESGLLYTLTRQGYGTGVTLYEPMVVTLGDQP